MFRLLDNMILLSQCAINKTISHFLLDKKCPIVVRWQSMYSAMSIVFSLSKTRYTPPCVRGLTLRNRAEDDDTKKIAYLFGGWYDSGMRHVLFTSGMVCVVTYLYHEKRENVSFVFIRKKNGSEFAHL